MRNSVFSGGIRCIRKTFTAITAFLCTTVSPASELVSWSSALSLGEVYTSDDGAVRTYTRPSDYDLIDGSPEFNVFVDGQAYTGIYQTKAESGQKVNFGYFDFKDGRTTKVVVVCKYDLGDYTILPSKAEVSDLKMTGDKILSFTITKANQWITIVPKSEFLYGRVLHLFCNALDENEPKTEKTDGSYDRKTKTYYFGPGYHDLSTKYPTGLYASNGRTVYIAGGAVVKGTVGIGNGGGTVKGHGMVVINENQGGAEFSADCADGGTLDGIICHRYHASGWQTTYTYTKNLTVSNLKIMCPDGGSSDGMDFQGCQDMTIDNCFIRANDDCVAIKGLAGDGSDPAECTQQIERNLKFTNMQFWTCANNAFGIGAETYAQVMENISLSDSEVLCHYDRNTHSEGMADRAALNICALTGTNIRNVSFDNIIVHHCSRFIALGFEDSFWYGTILGYQKYPGDISDVRFSNVSCPNRRDGQCANDVRLYGWDGDYSRNKGWYEGDTPTKYVHDIYFDNVTIEGKPFDSWEHESLVTNNTDEVKLVYDLHFNTLDGIGKTVAGGKETTSGKTTYYTLDGMTAGHDSATLRSGIYVARQQDGSTRKVVVR